MEPTSFSYAAFGFWFVERERVTAPPSSRLVFCCTASAVTLAAVLLGDCLYCKPDRVADASSIEYTVAVSSVALASSTPVVVFASSVGVLGVFCLVFLARRTRLAL